MIIVSTAFGGAWTAIVGALALKGDPAASQAAAHNDVWLAYPLNPAPGQRWVIVVWLALSAAGVIAQLSTPAARGARGEKSDEIAIRYPRTAD